jgi:adenylate cyclase
MVQNSVNINSLDLSEVRSRVTKTLKDGLQLDMSTQDCAKLLRRKVNSKINLVIMFVDINNSTELSLSLEEQQFALMVQIFAQEISNIVFGYDGYVFKYEGDAVIILFPAMYDEALACRNALNCSMAILEIVTKVINPAFNISELPKQDTGSNLWEEPDKIPCGYRWFQHKYGFEDNCNSKAKPSVDGRAGI